jgi:hypothetical protein
MGPRRGAGRLEVAKVDGDGPASNLGLEGARWSVERPRARTEAPRRASSSAVVRPIPFVALVTSAVRPANSCISSLTAIPPRMFLARFSSRKRCMQRLIFVVRSGAWINWARRIFCLMPAAPLSSPSLSPYIEWASREGGYGDKWASE